MLLGWCLYSRQHQDFLSLLCLPPAKPQFCRWALGGFCCPQLRGQVFPFHPSPNTLITHKVCKCLCYHGCWVPRKSSAPGSAGGQSLCGLPYKLSTPHEDSCMPSPLLAAKNAGLCGSLRPLESLLLPCSWPPCCPWFPSLSPGLLLPMGAPKLSKEPPVGLQEV